MGMPRSLYFSSTNVRDGVWAANGGGESPTGLFKQMVDKLANSFTKMTQSLPVFSMANGWLDGTGNIQFYRYKGSIVLLFWMAALYMKMYFLQGA